MKYLFFIVTSLFVGVADAQKPADRLIEMGLKGMVKQVTEVINFSEANNTSESSDTVIMNFDGRGQELDKIFKKNGQEKKTAFVYAKGKITERQFYHGKVIETANLLYNNNGQLIEFNSTHDEDPFLENPFKGKSMVIVKYDKKGNKIEEDDYFDGNKLSGKSSFIYNKNNQNVEEDREKYLSSGIKKEKSINKYNLRGEKVKSQTFDSLGRLIDEYSVTYSNFDQHGNWLLRIFNMKMPGQSHDDSFSKNITRRKIVYYQ